MCARRGSLQPLAHALDLLALGAAARCGATRPTSPSSPGWDKAALDAYRRASRAHDADRGAAAGLRRVDPAAQHLWVSSYLWSPRTSAFGPSDYPRDAPSSPHGVVGRGPAWWQQRPEGKVTNPWAEVGKEMPWPVTEVTREARLRREAARLVRRLQAGDPPDEGGQLDLVEQARVADWDADLDRLLAEARADRGAPRSLTLPTSLSATALARLREDPDGFAADLARPMPRQPSSAARAGTRFHAWVEARFGQQQLLDTDELSGRGDAELTDADLPGLIAAFEAGPFADRVPIATEAPFALVLAGQVVRGRIDAVYDEPGGGHLVVDWKTSRGHVADPVQLAIYRVAWAEVHGVPLEKVRAVFHFVRDGATVEPQALEDRAALEAVLIGAAGLRRDSVG